MTGQETGSAGPVGSAGSAGSDVGGYRGEEEAFRAYTAGVNPLAERLRGLADGDLRGTSAFGADAFSRIGSEVGLSEAIRAATVRQEDRVRGLADSLGGTSDAVRNTWTNFELTEQDAGAAVRRAAGELT